MASTIMPNALTTNYSILALPIYYAWALAPHVSLDSALLRLALGPLQDTQRFHGHSSRLCKPLRFYAVLYVVRNTPDHKWDNLNPRRPDLKEGLSKTLTAEQYGEYERAEAAHYNSLENFPVFATAVVLANLARVPVPELNSFVLGFGALRFLHTIVYVKTSNPTYTHLRSAIYLSALGLALRTIWRAGRALA
ncbi:MAG: hypothetical protein M1828_000639 [Chrysothrix sp. TS-e1954]|nr:MAG: hypothetical protein M1828_000639 [Chrysothrix sp. TS-e1954]